jgi:hypothetical protein
MVKRVRRHPARGNYRCRAYVDVTLHSIPGITLLCFQSFSGI